MLKYTTLHTIQYTTLTPLQAQNKGLALKSFSNKSTRKSTHYQYMSSSKNERKKEPCQGSELCSGSGQDYSFPRHMREELIPVKDDLGPLC